MNELITEKIQKEKLIAIVRGVSGGDILPTAEALYKGGISLLEIAFNPADPGSFSRTAEAISTVSKAFEEKICVGAGTVVSPQLVRLAKDSGARYIISPNVNIAVIEETRRQGLVSIPGAMTPSECMTAHLAGADLIKLFPAGALGPGYLTSLLAPFNHLKILCVGGIHEGNLLDFLKAGALGFGIGGNLVKKEWILQKEFSKITEAAKHYVTALKAG